MREAKVVRRWLREFVNDWRGIEEMSGELAALIAVTIACEEEAGCDETPPERVRWQTREWVLDAGVWDLPRGWEYRSVEWDRWVWRETLEDRVRGLKVALRTWLRQDLDASLEPGEGAKEISRRLAIVDGWTSLEETPGEVVPAMVCALLEKAKGATLLPVVRRMARAWVPPVDELYELEVIGNREWAEWMVRQDPALALKVAVEATLLEELEDDGMWAGPLLEWLTGGARAAGPGD